MNVFRCTTLIIQMIFVLFSNGEVKNNKNYNFLVNSIKSLDELLKNDSYQDGLLLNVQRDVILGKQSLKDMPTEYTSSCIDCNTPFNPKVKIFAELSEHGIEHVNKNKPNVMEHFNMNSMIFLKMAEESLNKYFSSSVTSQYYKVCSIENVETQAVSGKLTKINYTAQANCKIERNVSVDSPRSIICERESSDNNCRIECYTEIWEQPWLTKEVKVKCNNKITSRVKRGADYEEIERNPKEPKYRKFAETALKIYLKNNNIQQPYKVFNVVYVSIIYIKKINEAAEIYFQIAPRKCNKECVWEMSEVRDCHVSVTLRGFSVTLTHKYSTDCAGPRGNKKLSENNKVVSLINNINNQDPGVLNLAVRSLLQYLKTGENFDVTEILFTKRSKKDTIIKFQAQPNHCHIISKHAASCEKAKLECSSRASQNNRTLSVNCFKKLSMVQLPPKKEEDPFDPEFKKYAKSALHEYLKTSKIKDDYKIVTVLYVTSEIHKQPSSKRVFEVFYKISRTNCKYELGRPFGSKCIIVNPYNSQSCISEIKVNLAASEGIQTNTDCNLKPNKMQKINIIHNTNKTLDEWAQKSLNKYLRVFNIRRKYVVKQIIDVSSTGRVYKMQFLISSTNCLAGPMCNLIPFSCKTNDNQIIICYSEILNNMVNQVNCDDNRVTELGSSYVAGGIVERDPSEPIFKSLAEQSINVLAKVEANPKYFIVKQVSRATTQVIAGISYVIDFTMSPTNCSLDIEKPANCIPDDDCEYLCHCKIIEHPWFNSSYVSSITCPGAGSLDEFNEIN